jgi:ketosteroid isomerase-like protein
MTVKANASSVKIILIGVAMLFAGATAQSVQPVSDEDQIRAIEKAIATAENADQLMKYYAPDVTLYDLIVPSEYHGWKNVYANNAGQFKNIKNPRIAFQTLEVGVEGKLGYAYMTIHYESDSPIDGSHNVIVFRQTDILKKIDGRWLVTFQHISVPYDPKTKVAITEPAQNH